MSDLKNLPRLSKALMARTEQRPNQQHGLQQPLLSSQRDVAIIHFGPGAFFRSFVALYNESTWQLSQHEHHAWGIRGVSLQSATLRDTLAPQDYCYTAIELTEKGASYQIVNPLEDILVAAENPQALLLALAKPALRIVSLTITEKGYCHQPSNAALQLDHPDIQHDLAHANAPRSAVGFIVYALAMRFAAGIAPFSVLSCDNLPNNGAIARNVVVEFAQQLDPQLAQWIATQGRFPSCMVDRITPATRAADIENLASVAGYVDHGCVTHEAFRQWVIEDNFVANRRPQWDLAGAQFVQDVSAFETMKLRCLNGTHSCLAYLGYLAGYATIAQTVADPVFAQMLEQLWDKEILPTVPTPPGEDLHAYCRALKARYLNPAIQHRTWQIAMDGSQKLPQRLLCTIEDNLAAGREFPLLALAVAAWMRYVSGVDEKGAPIDVVDPLAKVLQTAAHSADSSAGKVAAILAVRQVFHSDLAAQAVFCQALVTAYDCIENNGVRDSISSIIAT